MINEADRQIKIQIRALIRFTQTHIQFLDSDILPNNLKLSIQKCSLQN